VARLAGPSDAIRLGSAWDVLASKQRDGSNPRVSRLDIEAAKTESWWGKVITVKPEQIFESR
jgi:hypothetical protein